MPLTNAQKQKDSRARRKAKLERLALLEESLDWAIAEIEARTRYSKEYQFGNCLAKAKEALGDYTPPAARKALGDVG